MRAKQRALGFYWGGVALALVLLAPLAPMAAAMSPPCLFRSLTGLPCPTCGTTRAVVALSHLDLTRALTLNPLATAAVVVFLLGGLAAGVGSLMGRPLREPTQWRPVTRLATLLAIGANWAWLLYRR